MSVDIPEPEPRTPAPPPMRLSGLEPMTIAPGALLRHLNTGHGVRADFDTERHPSVKIPVLDDSGRKVATVCVFHTGSVSIMGARHPSHMAAAFDTVCTALEECAPWVCSADPRAVRTTTAKQGLALEEGYPFNMFACCCVP